MTPIFSALMGLFILAAPQSGWATANTAAPAVALPSYQVTLTAYNAVPGQTDQDPLTTASGAYSNPDIVAARSVDLADELPFGTVVAIEPNSVPGPGCGFSLVGDDIGLRVIADSMNSRIRGTVDVLFAHQRAARALGVCRDVQIVVVGHIDPLHMPKSQTELKAMLGLAGLAAAK